MATKEIYRIKKGNLKSDNISIGFYFGIVYSDEGLLTLDLYINESFNLDEFVNDEQSDCWKNEFYSSCKTEEENYLELERLSFTKIIPHLSKANMICYGKLKHTKKGDNQLKRSEKKPKLHYLELEGLKMKFCDVTEQKQARRGKEILNFNNSKRDHTSTQLVSNKFPYNQIFHKTDNSETVIVEFPDDTDNTLTYERFQEIKTDYIYALSFLNGAEVRVRKEYTGAYYTIGKADSEILIFYSFPKVINRRFNEYLPLNNPINRSENVLNKFFIFYFDKYCAWNKKLNLNVIVFYLNNSEQAKSMEDRVFIQMIALERLTTAYAEYLGEKEEFIPNESEFEPIKNELLSVIDKYKEKFGNAYNTVKSKISNINQIKRLSTTDKMYRLIDDCGITITNDIKNLVDKVRHKTIHRGDIGKGKEAILNFHLLDELLREIILRLIEYKGKRKKGYLSNK